MTIAKNLNRLSKPIKSQIVDLIRVRGPITVSDYMKIVLVNPTSGFYMNNDVFGIKGHFTTNPEVSQIFGELIGAWIVNEWRRFGMRKPLRLVELGPGRGTLMSDLYRTVTKLDPSIETNIQVNLVEISNKLQEIQARNLKHIDNIKWNTHVNALETNKSGFTAFVAHEYFDAMPIHKFMKVPNKNYWRELLIDYDEKENLRFVYASKVSPTHVLLPEELEGNHIEVNAEGASQLNKVVKNLNDSGNGCMLMCDYGFDYSEKNNKSNRDTFRAFKNHKIHPPLDEPGSADLTADVDFAYFKEQVGKESVIFGPVTQAQFLTQCGMQARLEMLLQANKDQAEDLMSDARMMIEDMGERYKFMSIFPKSSLDLFEGDPPAGFAGQ